MKTIDPNELHIRNAYLFLRKNDHTTPDFILELMRDSAIEGLKKTKGNSMESLEIINEIDRSVWEKTGKFMTLPEKQSLLQVNISALELINKAFKAQAAPVKASEK